MWNEWDVFVSMIQKPPMRSCMVVNRAQRKSPSKQLGSGVDAAPVWGWEDKGHMKEKSS